MKVVTIWEDSGFITLIRDSEGQIYIPKRSDMTPDNIDLHIPISNEASLSDVVIPANIACFIDSPNENLIQARQRLEQLAADQDNCNLLIVTSSDSTERKEILTNLSVELFAKIRILEVTLPVSCLSPTLTIGGVSYRDINQRRRTNFPRRDIYEILSKQPYATSLDSLTLYILSRYIDSGEIWFPDQLDGTTYITSEYEISSGNFYHSELVPFVLTGSRDLAIAPSDYSDQVSQNSRHGIVRKLRRIKNHDSLPSSLITIQSDIADLRLASPWANNTVCQGSTFNDLRSAELSALGEGYERYCANIIDLDNVIKGSAQSLSSMGLNPVHPSDFILFSPDQLESPESRFEKFDETTVTSWVKGRNFQNIEKLVPVSMVFVNHRRLEKLGDFPLPSINSPAYAGISAGKTANHACVNAIQEIMERHATMCWWHNPVNSPAISVPEDSYISDLIAEFKNRGNLVSIVGIVNRFKVPIYAATILNIHSGIINTGFGCRPTNEAAISKALSEACTLQAGSFDLLNPDGELFKAIERGELWDGIAKPWRSDRLYLDYYRADFSDMNDLMLQQQAYLDPRLFPRVRPWLFPEQITGYLYPDSYYDSIDDELDFYLSKLSEMSLEPIMVDITSPDVRSLQISVVRVLVPRLVPNFAIGDIHLGKQAIQYEPVLLGFQHNPTPIEELNINPLPHC